MLQNKRKMDIIVLCQKIFNNKYVGKMHRLFYNIKQRYREKNKIYQYIKDSKTISNNLLVSVEVLTLSIG